MKNHFSIKSILRTLACVLGITNVQTSGITAGDLDVDAIQILTEKCHACHGVEFKHERLNVLDRETLVAKPSAVDDTLPFITPGEVDSSLLWQVINEDQMPPSGPLNDEQKASIKSWIEAGAAWPVDNSREFVSDIDVLSAISRHLFDIRKDDRRFQRYLTITHIHNNREVTGREIKVYKAALSKAVNSMSSQATIVPPKAIDKNETVFNIDLRHYGWQEFGTWDAVLKEYPYGLKPQSDIEALEFYEKIEELYGDTDFDGVTHLRADWFIATATRPPLYHTLANIPEKLDDLLKRVGVNIEDNFRLSTSRRAGLFESGVSGQNRLIEYHSSTNGTFWISYDFAKNAGKSNLSRFPLGPPFENNDFSNVAFEHAGGEIIFNLPNGLHAYMLTDGKGIRIDEGPVQIVWDALHVSGSPLIVNGVSCMSCHKHGMLDFSDFVRDGSAVQDPAARRKVQELYAQPSELAKALEDSRRNYLQRLRLAVGDALDIAPGDDQALLGYEEPISRVTLLYGKNLNLESAARELGFEDIEKLKNQVFSGQLVELGLGPLAIEGGTIKRAFWDSKESTASIFQDAASELRIGTPISN